MEILTISQIKRAALDGRTEAAVHGQVDALVKKETKDGKPFWEVTLADAEGKMTLRAWSDAPAFAACEELAARDFLAVSGEFAHSSGFGLDARRWTCRALTEAERDALLAGPPALREKQAADFTLIEGSVASVGDPRLLELARLFFVEYGARFRRSAAARGSKRRSFSKGVSRGGGDRRRGVARRADTPWRQGD